MSWEKSIEAVYMRILRGKGKKLFLLIYENETDRLETIVLKDDSGPSKDFAEWCVGERSEIVGYYNKIDKPTLREVGEYVRMEQRRKHEQSTDEKKV